MRFSQLKDFIENTMKMQEGSNYQPAMIKFLINVGGTASKPQILQGLQEENPEREIKKESVNTVSEVLTNHNVVKDNGDSTFTLLDYESYSNTERQHIVDICNKKIIEAATYSSERQNRIVLFSVSGEGSFEHFKKTILNDVDTSTFTNSEMKKFPKVRTWGSINNKFTYPRWEKLQKGDIILFYRDKKYVSIGILEETEHNQQVAQSMWGIKADTDQTWELIMYMLPENVIESNVDYQELNNLLDYKENFMPTRTLDFTLVRSEVIRSLNNKFGSTKNALSSIGFNLQVDSDYKNIENTNYLSLENFEKFLNAIPKLPIYQGGYSTHAALSPEMMQLLFKVTYYCALRISEALSIHKDDFDLESKILTIGESKSGITQKTTIPPKLVKDLKKVWDKLPEKPFDTSRQTIWAYAKKAGQLAGLNIFESQQNRDIEGIWPTIFRLSRAKQMENKGAGEGLIRLKLRLDYDQAIFKTDQPKIEELIEWEANEESIISDLSEDTVNYWKISPGEVGEDWENQKNKGLIGISFFDFGDLSKLSEEELREKIRQAYGKELTPAKQANTFGQMRDFMKIKQGDIILANSGKSKILGIGRVEGPYHYRKGVKFPHTFPVDWYDTTEGDIPKQEGWMITVIPLSKQEFDELMKFKTNYLLLRYKSDGKTQWTDEFGKSYHYSIIPNHTKLVKGSQTIWYDRKDGRYLFLGCGDVGTIRDEMYGNDSWAEMETFEKFNPPKHGTDELENKITNLPNFNNQHSILPITKEIYDEIINGKEQIQEIKTFEDQPLETVSDNLIQEGYKELSEELLIPENKVREIIIALASGSHVILAGPIGTGKTELARKIPQIFWKKNGGYYSDIFTATADWNTQDVIGGIVPKMENQKVIYKIQDGCVVESVRKNWLGDKRKPYKNYHGVWTIIDEFNRADIDKAFGQLFTSLRMGDLRVPTDSILDNYEQLKIPQDYRIIGTLNTADKHYLFPLSNALKSRFTFIEIDIPDKEQYKQEIYYAIKNAQRSLGTKDYPDLKLNHKTKTLEIDSKSDLYDEIYKAYNFLSYVREFKKLGTAILKIIIQNLITGAKMSSKLDEGLDNSINSTIIPQLEELSEMELDAIKAMSTKNIIQFLKEINKSNKRHTSHKVFSNTMKFLNLDPTKYEYFTQQEIKDDDKLWNEINFNYNDRNKISENAFPTKLDQVTRSLDSLIEQTII